MIELLVVLAYFAIGLVLFFSFWRWVASDEDVVGDKIASFVVLFFWPLAVPAMAFYRLMSFLMDCGYKVMKK